MAVQAQGDAFVAEIDACTQSLHAAQQETTRHVQQAAAVSAELEAERQTVARLRQEAEQLQQQERMADQRCAEVQEIKAKCEQRIAALTLELKVRSWPFFLCVLQSPLRAWMHWSSHGTGRDEPPGRCSISDLQPGQRSGSGWQLSFTAAEHRCRYGADHHGTGQGESKMVSAVAGRAL